MLFRRFGPDGQNGDCVLGEERGADEEVEGPEEKAVETASEKEKSQKCPPRERADGRRPDGAPSFSGSFAGRTFVDGTGGGKFPCLPLGSLRGETVSGPGGTGRRRRPLQLAWLRSRPAGRKTVHLPAGGAGCEVSVIDIH